MDINELKNIVEKTCKVEYSFFLPALKISTPISGSIYVSLHNISEDKKDFFVREKIMVHHRYPKPRIDLIESSIKITEISEKEKEKWFNHYSNLLRKGEKILWEEEC